MIDSRAPTKVEQLAEFACGARYEALSDEARVQLKLRVLDSLGCALGALGADVPRWCSHRCSSWGVLRLRP